MDTEALEFRKMLSWSAGAHVVFVIFALTATSAMKSRFFNEPIQTGPMNVMWATTVQSGPKTPDNKLPAPIVEPNVAPETKPEEPKVVMPEKLNAMKKAPTPQKAESEEEKRRRAMADAIASLNVKEQRPTPRPDNFPSLPNADTKGKYPAGPGGGGSGGIMADPVVAAYTMKIKKILTDNLIWVQKDKPKVVALVKIDVNGNVLDSTVVKSSGNSAYESAVLRAIRKSSPLPPPPPQVDEIELDFDLGRQR